MTTRIVVDSGILLADLLPGEPLHSQAKAILNEWQAQNIQLAAPNLFVYEIVAVIRKAVYQERINTEQGLVLVEQGLSYSVQLHQDVTLLQRGYVLATQYNRPRAYDAQYLALAEKLECDFWTTDERLYNAIHEQLSSVKWLGNFTTQDASSGDSE